MPTDPWEAWEPSPCHLLREENARYGWDEMQSGPQCPLLCPEDHWEERPSLAVWPSDAPSGSWEAAGLQVTHCLSPHSLLAPRLPLSEDGAHQSCEGAAALASPLQCQVKVAWLLRAQG